MARVGGFGLLEIERRDAIILSHPYLESCEIPRGAYLGRQTFPATAVQTLCTREILVISKRISAREAYHLISLFYENLRALLPDTPMLATQVSQIDPQKEFYYPLHEGAVAYYKGHAAPIFIPSQQLLTIVGYTLTIIPLYFALLRRRRTRTILRQIDMLVERLNAASVNGDRAGIEEEFKTAHRAAVALLGRYKIHPDDYRRIQAALSLGNRERNLSEDEGP